MKLTKSLPTLLLVTTASAAAAPGPILPPAPFPVFLRLGFSSVLEFDEIPARVVLGDSQAFQVERLEHSLVLRTRVAYATSNMFVYFKEAAPRLFVLTAAEDAEPTYFKRIESPKPVVTVRPMLRSGSREVSETGSRVLSALFDPKKDYLTVEVALVAESSASLRPKWDLLRLRYLSRVQAPLKLWSERKEVQKESSIRVRLIFAKPNIPRSSPEAAIILPIEGWQAPLVLPLGRKMR